MAKRSDNYSQLTAFSHYLTILTSTVFVLFSTILYISLICKAM